jgi:hypothetical protein
LAAIQKAESTPARDDAGQKSIEVRQPHAIVRRTVRDKEFIERLKVDWVTTAVF